MELKPVLCPRCESPLGRLLVGFAEYGCRRCKLRIHAASDGETMVITLVDKLPRAVNNLDKLNIAPSNVQ